MKNQPKGFYTIFDIDGKDVISLDKDFAKIIINFIKIEIYCLKCFLFFYLKLKKNKYIKDSYIRKAFCLFFFSFSPSFLLLPL